MGAETFIAIGKFVGAIFTGAAAGSSAAYVFAVNVARIGVLALSAKLTAPKLDLNTRAREKLITVRDSLAPQAFIYGEDITSGPLLYANVGRTDNKSLYYVVALAGHECDSIVKYRIDDDDIELSDLDGAFTGNVIGGRLSGAAYIDARLGTSTQAVFSELNTYFSGQISSNHTGRGWCMAMFRFDLVEGLEDVYDRGPPQNLRAVVRGKKVYDPRKDSTNGGAGVHRLNDATTWEWSENPALCLADFLRDDKFGMREEDDRIDWDLVIAAADICDQTVSIPSGTQKRYTINATFSATEQRREVRNSILGAMMGRMVFSQGVWKMWAGAAITPTITLTEDNLAGVVSLQASSGSSERYNRVRGKFIDPSRNYTANPYPEQRSSAYETEDNGEVRETVADFTTANTSEEAQRNAIITLRQSRNQRVLVWEGNLSCFQVQPGTTVLVDVAEYGFSGEKFFVTEWAFSEKGVNLTMVQEDDTVWADPAVGQYTTRSATGQLVFGEVGVLSPTNLAVQSTPNGVRVSWTAPLATQYDYVEIYASTDNNRNNAVLVATSPQSPYYDLNPFFENQRFYWIRAIDLIGRPSDFTPNLTTTTAVAYPLIGATRLIEDPFVRQGSNKWSFGSGTSYIVGGGLNGTDALQISTSSVLRQLLTAPRRGPDRFDFTAAQGMTIEARVRVSMSEFAGGGSFSSRMRCVAYVTDADGVSNPKTYIGTGGHLFTDTSPIGTWYDASYVIQIDDEENEAPPRYIQIGLEELPNLLGPKFRVDFIDANVSAGVFAPQASVAKTIGLVPDTDGLIRRRVLTDTGEWSEGAPYDIIDAEILTGVPIEDFTKRPGTITRYKKNDIPGVTDLSAGLDAARQVSEQDNSVAVRIPRGKHLINVGAVWSGSASSQDPDNTNAGRVEIIGEGIDSVLVPGMTDGSACLSFGFSNWITLRDFRVDTGGRILPTKTTTNCIGIELALYGSRNDIQNVHVWGCAVGWYIEGFILRHYNIWASHCDKGFEFKVINASHIVASAENCIQTFSLVNSSGVVFDNFQDEGILTAANTSPVPSTIDDCENIVFDGARVEGNSSFNVANPRPAGYYVIGSSARCRDITFRNFQGAVGIDKYQHYIDFVDCDGCHVDGFFDSFQAHSAVRFGEKCSNITYRPTFAKTGIFPVGEPVGFPIENSGTLNRQYNHFPNSNFDLWFRGWSTVVPNNVTLSKETALVRSGAHALRVTCTNAAGGFNSVAFRISGQSAIALRGKTATLCAWVYVPDIAQYDDADTTSQIARAGIVFSTDGATRSDDFVDGDVDIVTDQITMPGHPWNDGDNVRLTTSGTLPGGLSTGTTYFVGVINSSTIAFYQDRDRTQSIGITSAAGGGTHTITEYTTSPTQNNHTMKGGWNWINVDGNVGQTATYLDAAIYANQSGTQQPTSVFIVVDSIFIFEGDSDSNNDRWLNGDFVDSPLILSYGAGGKLVQRGTAAPTDADQEYETGDQIVYEAPSVGGHVGLVCTAAGPGGSATFNNFGSVIA